MATGVGWISPEPARPGQTRTPVRHPLATALPLAVVLASCRTVGPVAHALPEGFPDHSVQEILARLPAADSLWAVFRVDASLAFATPEGSGSFSADIVVRRPDSILLRVKAPLGIEVARALVTRDSLLLYDRVQRTLYAGPADSELLPAGLRSSDLSAAFFGFDPVPAGPWSVRADSLLYRLEREDGDVLLLVDPATWRVTARDTRARSGEILERRRFTEFVRYGGLILPRRIVTVRPPEGTRASFFVRNVEPFPADTDMDLGVRPDARRVAIR